MEKYRILIRTPKDRSLNVAPVLQTTTVKNILMFSEIKEKMKLHYDIAEHLYVKRQAQACVFESRLYHFCK